MNPIRVAHVLPFRSIGGTEISTLQWAEAGAQAGFESLIYCPDGANDVRALFHKSSFVTGSYEQVEPSYHHPLPYLRVAQRFAQELRRHKVGIVHCADILAAHYASLAGRLAGAYVISHVRCEHSSISRRDQSFLYPVQKFIFVSKSTWQSFGMRVPDDKGEVVYEGFMDRTVNPISADEARRSYGIEQDGPVIGMAARVHPSKDFETLIHAARFVTESRPDCSFLIAGEYDADEIQREYFRRLQQLIDTTGMTGRMKFIGFESDMGRFFSALDCFVLSSHGEGFPMVVLEAMAHQKPVVATNVGGIPEMIVDGETGLVVMEHSPRQLADALLSLLADPTTGAAIACAGREHVRQNFGEQQFRRRVKKLYCSIAKQRGLIADCVPCIPT
jgi:glycosyltransferase involved in cell wall biosynthesis